MKMGVKVLNISLYVNHFQFSYSISIPSTLPYITLHCIAFTHLTDTFIQSDLQVTDKTGHMRGAAQVTFLLRLVNRRRHFLFESH